MRATMIVIVTVIVTVTVTLNVAEIVTTTVMVFVNSAAEMRLRKCEDGDDAANEVAQREAWQSQVEGDDLGIQRHRATPAEDKV